jgi:hypothetical protein
MVPVGSPNIHIYPIVFQQAIIVFKLQFSEWSAGESA